MQGFQLSFFTRSDARYGHHPLGDWLVQEARRLGMGGATLIGANEGYGRDRRIHSVHFIEMSDQPIEVSLAVSAEDCDRSMARLRELKLDLFNVKAPIEFGRTLEGAPGSETRHE